MLFALLFVLLTGFLVLAAVYLLVKLVEEHKTNKANREKKREEEKIVSGLQSSVGKQKTENSKTEN